MNQEIINIQNITDNHFQSSSEWKEVEFSKMLVDESISYGIVQPGSHTETNSVPIIRVNNIKLGYIKTDDVLKVDKAIEEKYLRTRLEGGELLITVVGSIGECAIVPENLKGWNVARAVSVARIQDGYDKRFIKYAFKTDDLIFQMYGNTNDTVQPTLNLSSLKTLKFNIPALSEQHSIASVLSSLDDKIDLLHHQNTTLEAIAETLFRQWFVEEAKENWEETTLEKHFEISRGLSYKGSGLTVKGFGLPMHNLNSVYEGGGYKYEGIKFYSGEYRDRHLVNPGDIIVTNTEQGHEFRLIGFPAIIPSSFGGSGIFSQHIYKLAPLNSTYLSNEFIYYLLMTPAVREQIVAATNGSTVNMLAIDGLQRPEFRLPPKVKVAEFTSIVSNHWKKKNFNQSQIATLTALRDTLLPKLMSGEVRVEI